MKLVNLIAAAVVTVNSGLSLAADRPLTIKESSKLSTLAAELGDETMRRCNCQNTMKHLYKIADLAVDVEVEARFGTANDTTDKFKEVVKTVLSMKKYVRNMHDQSLKVKIRREILVSVNTLGRALMGNNFPMVAFACSEDADPEQCADLEYSGLESALDSYPESEFE